MAVKDNGMGPGKKPKAATKVPQTTSKVERRLTTVEKRGDTTFTKYPKQNGMQVTRVEVTKMNPKDTTKKK
jgi:hypothetical protein